ncbi:mandelate racemase/muconate lactonizing enzyme family protein [Pacificispira sp.]|uniref:mandelate racemase/muconate lactonizing enzyme family protein n=1 Tax=Pacificispira sp. TaxID=2888761 RepID=UPI003BA86915
MTNIHFEIRHLPLPLKEPYWLAFGPVSTFDTFIVRAEGRNGVGHGEITPLPGYSFETGASVLAAFEDLASSAGLNLSDCLNGRRESAPMAMSGLAAAADAIEMGDDRILGFSVGSSIPCVALCGGTEPKDAAARAHRLSDDGYTVLKMKIGGDVQNDLRRAEAVSAVLPEYALIRVDANQQMSEADALTFAKAAGDFPIELMEQPYAPDADARMLALRDVARVPLMLDESIWTRDDIDRAAKLGMDYVKLKLCKHLGLRENLALLEHARSLGLKVVYGNGVQGALGNRQEAFLYLEAGLTTAIESNGFSKIAAHPADPGMRLEAGALHLDGITDAKTLFDKAEPVAELDLSA